VLRPARIDGPHGLCLGLVIASLVVIGYALCYLGSLYFRGGADSASPICSMPRFYFSVVPQSLPRPAGQERLAGALFFFQFWLFIIIFQAVKSFFKSDHFSCVILIDVTYEGVTPCALT
jgi:hypothetical protein